MKLNLSKTKELVIKGRTTLPPPDPIIIVTIEHTYVTSEASWSAFMHFDDLMKRALKHMHICLKCVKEMVTVYLTFNLTTSLPRYVTFHLLY